MSSFENWGGRLKSLLRLANSPYTPSVHTQYHTTLQNTHKEDK